MAHDNVSNNKTKIVTVVVGISLIALMFVVGSGLIKKILVGPDKVQIDKKCCCDKCGKECKCTECKCVNGKCICNGCCK